jgi:hypothetical protein
MQRYQNATSWSLRVSDAVCVRPFEGMVLAELSLSQPLQHAMQLKRRWHTESVMPVDSETPAQRSNQHGRDIDKLGSE